MKRSFGARQISPYSPGPLVILIATSSTFNFPLWPIMAIYGIDELMDMARTSVNVIGNTLASCVIARWEGEFDDKKALEFEPD